MAPRMSPAKRQGGKVTALPEGKCLCTSGMTARRKGSLCGPSYRAAPHRAGVRL
jgi:hypothetical protein